MPDTLSTEIANGASPNDRAETNRENARKSTGPRTEAGKQRSSLNALRHGSLATPSSCHPTTSLPTSAIARDSTISTNRRTPPRSSLLKP